MTKLKIAHCDCGEWHFKHSISDYEIRKNRGEYCVDCSSKIDITTVKIAPLIVPETRSQEQIDKDLDLVSAWLGI